MKRFFDKVYIIAFSSILVALAALLVLLPDKEFSEKENRSLMQAPNITAKNALSGEYTTDLASYFADQFPFRDLFVACKAYSELLQGKCENNGVIYASGDILIPRANLQNIRLQENLNIISEFSSSSDIAVTIAALPRTADVFSEALPESYPKSNDYMIWDDFNKSAEQLKLSTARLYDTLCESNAYYRTDHHYTSQGAYLTYKALGEALDYTPKEEAFFNKDTITDEFCGTAMRTSGFYLAKKDEIILFRYNNDSEYTVLADGEQIDLYDFSKLDTTDKYAVFLGGNHARVDIKGNSPDRQRLLIIRDSFADSIAPFLALHFDLTMIDLRYYSDSVYNIIEQEGIDAVLILESIEELATAKNISYLNMR